MSLFAVRLTSMTEKQSLTIDILKELTKVISDFAQWIAELIRQKNWLMLVCLLDAGLLLGAKPIVEVLATFLGFEVPENFGSWLWLTVGLIFIVAIAIAVATMPKAQVEQTDFRERKAIKGLRSFTKDDADVFARLQREGMIKECLESLDYASFRFGFLVGESGCGKSSFLQAGLLPQLSKDNGKALAIYIRFSDKDPLETIENALVGQLGCPLPSEKIQEEQNSKWFDRFRTNETDNQTDPFLILLQSAAQVTDRPLILFFDQFEQFFVHDKQSSDRAPLVNGLKAWYLHPNPSDIKILFSIRSDLYHNVLEIQDALGYSPNPQELFRLHKFTPSQATQILAAIADIEGLSFDQNFVAEVAAMELANREDGLISPVDLQVLAWMIEKQTAAELRAFNRTAFQRFGGIEGLLTRFLERTLDARVTEKQRQATLKVLLALTDLERGVRANVLSLEALQEQLKASVSPSEVREATVWLSRGDVRLITPVRDKTAQEGYELAHEKIIPALRKVAGQELSDVDRANQLLDRRVNEWLGNEKSSRYLLGWRDWYFLERQKVLLTLGTNEEAKKQLLFLSNERYTKRLRSLTALIVLGFSLWIYLLSPTGQLLLLKAELAWLGFRYNVSSVPLVFVKNGNWFLGRNVCKAHMNSPIGQADFCNEIARVAIELDEQDKAAKFLELATTGANVITDSSVKANALEFISNSIKQLENTEKASKLLELALVSAKEIQNETSRSYALRAIAESFGQLEDTEKASKLLELALVSAKEIQNENSRSSALRAIAESIGQLEDTEKASKLLELALASAKEIQNESDRSNALRAIAESFGQLENTEKASELLELALVSAKEIQNENSRSYALRAIAESFGQLENTEKASKLLELAFVSAKEIQNENSRSSALGDIAESIGHLEDTEKASELLELALASAKEIQESNSRSYAQAGIAQAHILISRKLDNKHSALASAMRLAKNISNLDAKTNILLALAHRYAEEERWGKTRRVVNMCRFPDCRLSVLEIVLTVKAEASHPELTSTEK